VGQAARQLLRFGGKFVGSDDAIDETQFARARGVEAVAEQRSFAACGAHPDFAEGLAGFFEKRKPVYGRS
ncbi:MAG: hypothetical protein J0I91_17935, partial [Candidatus Accumulibacter sp.]|nr:hypothetical protein [Accumulibacter sp.]